MKLWRTLLVCALVELAGIALLVRGKMLSTYEPTDVNTWKMVGKSGIFYMDPMLVYVGMACVAAGLGGAMIFGMMVARGGSVTAR